MELVDYDERIRRESQGSVIVVIATDAPMSSRQLKRMGLRASVWARPHRHPGRQHQRRFCDRFFHDTKPPAPHRRAYYSASTSNDPGTLINTIFDVVTESTEEAVLNSLFKAETMIGRDNRVIHALPIQETVELIKRYGHPHVHICRDGSGEWTDESEQHFVGIFAMSAPDIDAVKSDFLAIVARIAPLQPGPCGADTGTHSSQAVADEMVFAVVAGTSIWTGPRPVPASLS